MIDKIFNNLGLYIPFETKYKNLQKYLIDFLVLTDNLLIFFIKFLQKENLDLENVRLTK
jgi:hypothetical protein